MLVLKYICAVIALLSTLIFICNIITTLANSQMIDTGQNNNVSNYATLRLILILIMSITWPILFIF